MCRIENLAEDRGGDVEVNPPGRPDTAVRIARDTAADILGPRHPVRRLDQRLGDRQLVHLLVVAR